MPTSCALNGDGPVGARLRSLDQPGGEMRSRKQLQRCSGRGAGIDPAPGTCGQWTVILPPLSGPEVEKTTAPDPSRITTENWSGIVVFLWPWPLSTTLTSKV